MPTTRASRRRRAQLPPRLPPGAAVDHVEGFTFGEPLISCGRSRGGIDFPRDRIVCTPCLPRSHPTPRGRDADSHPAARSQAEIADLNAEIAGLKRDGDEIADKLEQRSKRFAGFMHSLHDLQMQLAEEAASSGGGGE